MKDIKIYAFADEASPQIEKQIIALNRNGLNGLEMRNVDGVNISDITLEKAKEVKSKLSSNGLITWSIGSPIGKIDIEKDNFEAHKDKLKHTLEIANILDAKYIRMFSFFIPKDKVASDYKNEVIDRLGVMYDISKDSGVSLIHENEKGIYGDVPERCFEIHKALPEIGGVFDPANYVQCGVDTLTAWDMLKDYILYMHIKDAKSDGSVVPAGQGEGNVKEIVSQFIAQGGNAFTIEPHLKIFDGFSALEQEGEKSVISECSYPDSDSAFDAACKAFKELL